MAKITATVKGSKVQIQRELYEQIRTSTQQSPELNKEINRILQVANRRIQNIESKGYFSPALQGLYNEGLLSDKKFQKFSTAGMSWDEKKALYGRAVAFLQQGTSTAQGAKAYNDKMAKEHGMTAETMRKMHDKLTHGGTLSESDVYEKTATYAVITNYIMEQARRTSSIMDAQARAAAAELEMQIDAQAASLSMQVANSIDSALKEAVANINAGPEF